MLNETATTIEPHGHIDQPVAAGFGIAWDPEWSAPDRLLVRGYRAATGLRAIARWDVEALIATVDASLEAAAWPDIDRRAARAAIQHLYAPDLADPSPDW